jgi:salicylate hydroxylase
LTHVPNDVIQYGHEVLHLEVTTEGVRLQLDNGFSEVYDFVVAADGIYSKVRKRYISTHTVEFKGAVAYRKIFPFTHIENITTLPNDTSAWRSGTDVVFLSRLGLDVYGIVIIRSETKDFASTLQWQRPIGTQAMTRLREIYKDWDQCISHVLHRLDDLDAYPLDSGPWMNELVRDGRVAFVGDAAHPTAGAFGAGASMGFGDCWALYRSLQVCQINESLPALGNQLGGYDLKRALAIFNETRGHFLKRVEQQMTLDKAKGAYIAAAENNEQEWIRRFIERNPPNHWLTEHSVELEFQKTLEGEALWRSQRARF